MVLPTLMRPSEIAPEGAGQRERDPEAQKGSSLQNLSLELKRQNDAKRDFIAPTTNAFRKYHVGRGNEADGAEQFFRDETRLADDRAFWLKVRDAVTGSFRQDVFEGVVARMTESTKERITGDPVKAIEVIQKKYALNDGQRTSVLTHLIEGGDLTRYGLVNAVTRASQDVEDYDQATDMERLGGTVLELPRSEWAVVAEAR